MIGTESSVGFGCNYRIHTVHMHTYYLSFPSFSWWFWIDFSNKIPLLVFAFYLERNFFAQKHRQQAKWQVMWRLSLHKDTHSYKCNQNIHNRHTVTGTAVALSRCQNQNTVSDTVVTPVGYTVSHSQNRNATSDTVVALSWNYVITFISV